MKKVWLGGYLPGIYNPALFVFVIFGLVNRSRKGKLAKQVHALIARLFLHLHKQLLALLDIIVHGILQNRRLDSHELCPSLGTKLPTIKVFRLLGHSFLHLDKSLKVFFQITTHDPLHGATIKTNDLRQGIGRKYGHLSRLLFEGSEE